jgi:tetratricopeptide (TPR) repeat protein
VSASPGDPVVRLWDVETGKELRRLTGHEQGVVQVAFCADGRRALSCDAAGSVRLWDLDRGEELHRFDPSWGFGLALSADGGRVLTRASEDKIVRVWELEDGPGIWARERTAFRGHTATVTRAFLFGGGRRALSAGSAGDFRLWDVDTAKELRSFDQFRQARFVGELRVAFSPDGRRAVVCGADTPGPPMDTAKFLHLRDVDDGKELRQFGEKATAEALAFSTDGQYVLSGGPDAVMRVWAAEGGAELLHVEGGVRAVTAVAFSPDGNRAVSGDATGALWLWQLPLAGDKALADFTAAIRLDARNALAHALRARCYLELKEYTRALADCTEAIRLDRSCAPAYVARGRLSMLAREPEAAIRDFTEALSLEPGSARAFYYRGLTQAEQGRMTQARADLEKALQLDPALDRK